MKFVIVIFTWLSRMTALLNQLNFRNILTKIDKKGKDYG